MMLDITLGHAEQLSGRNKYKYAINVMEICFQSELVLGAHIMEHSLKVTVTFSYEGKRIYE